MPEPPVIAGVATRKIATSDTLRSVTVTVRAPADRCPAYYHVSTKVLPDELRYLPALFGCVRADVPGEEVEILSIAAKRVFPTVIICRSSLPTAPS